MRRFAKIPSRWLLALALASAACGDDLAATPFAGEKDAGAIDDRPAPQVDATTPDVSAADTGGEPTDGDGAPRPAHEAATSDAAATPDVTPDAGLTLDAGTSDAEAGAQPLKINVLAIGELTVNGGPEIHAPFVQAAKTWLATQTNLTVTHIESPNTLTDTLLANYGLILQLNFTPFRWNATAQAAFEKYISEGKGGWVGMHHAGLYGPAVTPSSERPWTWYFNFFGQINYKNYIATFAEATVRLEESAHPIFKGVPATFQVTTDEWYTWDKSPRPNVHVLANVDENSYRPASTIKMGDHPVVWSNEAYRAKNLYIFMGHHPNLFQNAAYVTLLTNAIFWAGAPAK